MDRLEKLYHNFLYYRIVLQISRGLSEEKSIIYEIYNVISITNYPCGLSVRAAYLRHYTVVIV